ncbi:hypothetical protein HK102_002173, partial [Quaeritorhiza haematococci]
MAEKLSKNSEDKVLVEIEEGVSQTQAKIIPVMFTKDFPDAGFFISYAYKQTKDAVHVASKTSVHDTFGKLFRNQIISLNVHKLHDVVYDILSVVDKVQERADHEGTVKNVCALVRKLPTRFTGRASEVNQVWEKVSDLGVCLISAPGGMGKSCVAAKVARGYEKYYNYVLWVNCDSAPDAINGFREVAAHVGLHVGDNDDAVLERVCRWFASNRKYLMVLDNVDEIDVLYKDNGSGVLQALGKFGTFAGDVIVTTRNPSIRKTLRQGLKMVEPGSVTLEKWDLDTTRSFLLDRTPSIHQRLDAPTEKNAFDTLLQQLDGYPLAAEQIGAYLMDEAVSVADCLQSLDTVLINEEGDEDNGADRGRLGGIVALQFNSIKAQGDLGNASIRFLGVISCFNNESIPRGLMEKVLEVLQIDTRLSDVLRLLIAQSLLRLCNNNTFSNHALLHSLLGKYAQTTESMSWAVKSLKHAFPEQQNETYNRDEIPLGYQLIPHVQALLPFYTSSTEDFSNLLEATFSFADFLGNYNTAKTVMEHHLHIDRSDIPTSKALHNLGRVADSQGDYVKAEELYTESLAIKEKVYGRREHPFVAATLNDLAGVVGSQGDYVKAAQLYTETLAIEENVYGTREHPSVAATLNGLGCVADSQGDYVKAEQLYTETLAIKEKVYGTREHPSVATTLNQLGRVVYSQGDYVKGEQLYTESLAILEKVYGTREHPDVAATLNYLGHVGLSQGDYVKAEQLFSESLAIEEKVYGTREHPDVATTLNYLGRVADSQGDYVKAEQLLAESLAIKEKVYGTREHPAVATTLNYLGVVACSQGDYVKAEQLYTQTLAIEEKVYGTREHPEVAITLKNLAGVADSQGDYVKAEQLYTETLTIEEKVYGTREHPEVAITLKNLSEVKDKADAGRS